MAETRGEKCPGTVSRGSREPLWVFPAQTGDSAPGAKEGGPRSLLESLELTESPLMINCLLFRVLFYQCLLQINNVKKLYGSSRRNISFFAYRQAKLKQRVLFK